VRPVIVLSIVAAIAAFIPLPSHAIERFYSRGIYPILQNGLTWMSSLVPVALLDIALIALTVSWIAFVVRQWRARGRGPALRAGAASLLMIASIVVLIFFAFWGLNYRRVPLEAKLHYDAARITGNATTRFAELAVDRVNSLESRKEATAASHEILIRAFADTQRRLGATRTARPAEPKTSLFSWYLRLAGIDGMVDPWFLEILVNPDVLPIEYPFTVTHEWAHLAGYANESEANFVAWLTCLAADERAQYSGWLEAYQYARAVLPRDLRRDLDRRLAPDVVADLRAIAERLGSVDPAVSGFARNVYDSYLRAQGVDEGIASYGAMLRLMLGTTFQDGWVPQMRNGGDRPSP
jgi:uncharacterized protein DUF3810